MQPREASCFLDGSANLKTPDKSCVYFYNFRAAITWFLKISGTNLDCLFF